MNASDVLKVLKIARAVLRITYYIKNASVAHVCQTFNQVCVVFNVFLFFAFSLSCSTMFCFDKANRLSAIFFNLVFKFGASPVFP